MAQESNLSVMLKAIDHKKRDYFDQLPDDLKKKHSSFLALRWASTIHGTGDLPKYYVLSTNQQVNKHFWSLNKHPKLQWLLTSCISPNMGSYRHEYIPFKSKQAKNKRAQLIAELYPTMKMAEAEMLDAMTTDAELEQILVDRGWQDKDIKKTMKEVGNDN